MEDLMVRRRVSAVSNHELKQDVLVAFILRDARKGALLRMRTVENRTT
jgi:hypothetical protein